MENCLIVVNTYKEESQELAKKIKKFLDGKKILSSFYEFNGFSDVYPFTGFDFVITLGGDGTVLFASRGCAELQIPVFPINLGQFGFIAGIQKEEWKKSLSDFLDNKIPVIKRSLLSYRVERNNEEIISGCSLNDIVVSAQTAVHVIALDLACNDISLGQCKADGIIVATSTGSTAYSASAGGPIVDPELDAMVLTPVNPFSLSMRPLVINSNSELRVRIIPSREKNISLTIDGQKPYVLIDNDVVKITKLKNDALLVGTTKENFYNALRFKLNWSGEPHA
ncbi:MAG: NAD(+)/NADH kinase [Treponema sp.]|uniref:NAD(+)/NADH kinase n=1 Tax=Treponema sp. TaxID=166 RepID=UPI001B3CB108|nr:NAD(+)/NADH kinase [Treponema sp.]MBP5401533.1 NAD(+)/NADH kinase [Treponema sp.]MBR5932917.1 NAD(+)/NADH kinase [Treponema sp.]